jgi:tRNA threonylcarbamoyladenosine biosynthesis protein TsaE
LRGGEVLELVSDLGGGKTTFVRGLASGMGSKDHVSSPTFKISNEYKGGNLTLHHFDFYRLSEAGVVAHELHDVLDDPKAVIVVEWSDIVKNVLPADRLTIQFKSTGEKDREIAIAYPESLKYMVEKL